MPSRSSSRTRSPQRRSLAQMRGKIWAGLRDLEKLRCAAVVVAVLLSLLVSALVLLSLGELGVRGVRRGVIPGASDSALDVSVKIRTVIVDWAAFSGWHFSALGERGLLRLPVPGTTE